MDHVVFDQYNLDLFLNGTTALYKVFLSVLEDDGLHRPYAQQDLIMKINESIATYWHPLEAIFVKDPYTGYEKGHFGGEESTHPSKVLIDICDGINVFLREIKTSMDKSYSNEAEMRDTIRQLREELTSTKQELRDIHQTHNGCRLEIASLRATTEHMQKINKGKTDQIVDLQRANTVQLWEKEKDRLLQKNAQKMKDLETQVEDLTAEKAALTHRMQHFETKLGAEKLKNEIHQHQSLKKETSPTGTASEETNGSAKGEPVNVLQLRQHVYVLEKDLRKVDQELHNQQKLTVGLFHGIMTDYTKTFQPFIDRGDDVEGIEPNTLLRIKGLQKIITNCWELARQGKLSQAYANLPDYYIAMDRDLEQSPVRKISVGYNANFNGLAPLPKKGLPTIKQENEDAASDLTQAKRMQIRRASIAFDADHNPQIVNQKTGYVNHTLVLKYFPYFTKDYVYEQYNYFKDFDTNGDGSLDITEVMSAMQKTLGMQFTAKQIKEAMVEVDVDGDHTIDFFEYLKVADMMAHKTGQSDVFRSDLVKQQGRNMAKTCSVM